jgi:uncharacterized Zn finger protein
LDCLYFLALQLQHSPRYFLAISGIDTESLYPVLSNFSQYSDHKMGQEATEAQPEQAVEAQGQQGKKEKKEKQPKQPKPSQKPKQANVAVVGGKKQGTEIIGVTASKDGNFAQWYQELVIKAELVEYYNEVRTDTPCSPGCGLSLVCQLLTLVVQISGFYILRRELACAHVSTPSFGPID